MPHLGTSLFDHKAITMSLNSDKVKSKIYVNPSVFSYPRTDDIVWAAVADTYLNHAVPDQEMPVEEGYTCTMPARRIESEQKNSRWVIYSD
jgi:hypothetical protein